MATGGRKEGLCDLSNVVAFGHNEQWRPKAAKVATKLDINQPNGKTAPGSPYMYRLPETYEIYVFCLLKKVSDRNQPDFTAALGLSTSYPLV